MNSIIKNEINNTLERCIQGVEITTDEVKRIMEETRKQNHLDMVFFVSNSQYKYQLNPLIVCGEENAESSFSHEISITVETYNRMVKEYQKDLLSEQSFFSEESSFQGSVLHCGIMKHNTYLGEVGFRDAKQRVWKEEEKEQLRMLGRLLLIYIGLKHLDREQNFQELLIHSMMKDHTLSCFYLNFVSGQCHGIRRSSYLKERVEEWGSYSDLQKVYTDQFMDPIYAEKMQKEFSLDAMRKSFQEYGDLLTMDYPRILNDTAKWFRYTVKMIDKTADGEPYHAMVAFDDITDETKKNAYYAHATEKMQNTYIVIANVDLETEQYGVFVDNRSNEKWYTNIGVIGGYREQMNKVINEAIVNKSITSENIEHLRSIFSISNLREHFGKSSEMLSYEFPLTLNNQNYWVRLEAVPVHNYAENNRKVILYYSDFTHQKEKEWKLQEISEVLEQEHERMHQTEKMLLQDDLTGVYNRKGFEEIVMHYKKRKEPMGFLMIDIDHFKSVNDTFGHEFGDEVLIMVARQLQTVFRNEDKVFRLGGDEFAVLLCGCGGDAWDSIQMKFAGIHRYLKKTIKNEIPITVSAGLSLSGSGYMEEMYGLSDEALYYTKSKGRAGLTQIDGEHHIVNFWNDVIADENRKNQMKRAEIGKWHAEYSIEEGEAPRLFYDDMAHFLLGIPDTLTPEECYVRWYENVAPGYKEIVREMNDKIIKEGQAECTYLWEHPVQGQILLRDGGKLVENGQIREMYGYVQSLKNTGIVLNEDEGSLIMRALNSIYFCSYYISLVNGEYYTFKGNSVTEGFDVHTDNVVNILDSFIAQYVHPDFQKSMEAFVELKTLSQRLRDVDFIDCEYLTLTDKGWCRSRFMPVKWDEDGNLTNVLYVIYSIDAVKRETLEKERAAKEAIQIQLRVGEIISKSNVLYVGILNKNNAEVMLFDLSTLGKRNQTYSFEVIKEWVRQWIREEDILRFSDEFTFKQILQSIAEHGSYAVIYPVLYKDDESKTIMYHCEPLKEGSDQLIVVVEDVTNVAAKEMGQMQKMLTSEQKLLSCVRTMTGISNHYEAIEFLLNQIVEHYQCDRACLSHLTGKQQGTVIMECCRKGIENKFYKGERFTLSDFMYWESVYSPIKLNKVYCEGDESEEQHWMREAGLDNLMILSFVFCEEEVGYISIDNIRQNKDNSNWIATLAFFIANELQKLEHEEQLANLIYVDSMTGCRNRAAFNKRIEELKHSNLQNIGIIVASMNGLKRVNDAMGNQFGDQLLKKTAGILTDAFPRDEVYRIGGDEFVVISIGKEYFKFVDRADVVSNRLVKEEKGLAAVGYVWDESAEQVDELEKRAEMLMRSEKQNYYMQHQNEQNKRPAYIRHAAEELAESHFVVFLQPKCFADSEKVYGAEALVRKINEDGTIVVPYEFISILEQENLISNVDYFVLETVCNMLARWKNEGHEDFEISCNFSRITVAANHFVDQVFEILDRTGVDSSKLIFEITESSNVVPFEKMTAIMLALKKRNIRFAIDDMGTEYSTLQMLKLPTITTIKFDRTLINQLEGDDRECYIVQSLIKLCHGLGMECIAEGVEKREQLELLKEMECDKIQGYLIGKPMPTEEFEEKYVKCK